MIRRGTRLICAVLLAVSLFGCSAVADMFGVGGGYADEGVIANPDTEGETAVMLCDMVRMLSVNSPVIATFDSVTEAMEKCRDSVLYYMLTKNYGKYTGDIEKLDAAVSAYPQMQIANFIPAREFEETVYKNFGGNRRIGNESARLFIYLEKVNGYTSVSMLDYDPVDVEILELSETEHTYRMRIRNSLGGITSPEYSIMFIKRDDGTAYFKYVRENG